MRGVAPEDAVAGVAPVLGALPVAHYKTEGDPVPNDPAITVLHCLQGLESFIALRLVSLAAIDVEE